MPTVFLCSPTNSQMFTTFCEVAILPHQSRCPRCRSEVTPIRATPHETEKARWEVAYGPHRRRAQARENHPASNP